MERNLDPRYKCDVLDQGAFTKNGTIPVFLWTFIQVNAGVHMAHYTLAYKAFSDVNTSAWPRKSPAHDIIESFCGLLALEFYYHILELEKVVYSVTIIHNCGDNTSRSYIKGFYRSEKRDLTTIVKKNIGLKTGGGFNGKN